MFVNNLENILKNKVIKLKNDLKLKISNENTQK